MFKGINRIGDITNPFRNWNSSTLASNHELFSDKYFVASEKDLRAWSQMLMEKARPYNGNMGSPIDTRTSDSEDVRKSNVEYIQSVLIPQVVKSEVYVPPRIVWIDCETSGLDADKDTILELSCVVTEMDEELHLVAEHETVVVHHDEKTISNFSPWCVINHAKSGLTEEVRASTNSLQEAEDMLLQFITKFTLPNAPLAGNSVHMDKRFIDKLMPKISQHLSYRLIDVSSLSQLCKHLNYDAYSTRPKKSNCHRARIDIYESIFELKHYQKYFLKLLK
jgi:oligoribonuclease